LARRGAHVIIASRNKKLSEKACKQIIKQTKNSKVEYEELYLDDFESIRGFVERIKKRFSHLDILVNNAGILAHPYTFTKDGIEEHLSVNYLGMINLLFKVWLCILNLYFLKDISY
jgi:NAD(P)-dependent dehydrogenase (short-subunit alcohol dehydrogenase family)